MSGSGIGGTGAITNSGGNSLNAFNWVTLDGDTVFGDGRYDLRSQIPTPRCSMSIPPEAPA